MRLFFLIFSFIISLCFSKDKFSEEYYAIKDGTQQRQEFFNTIKPLIIKANINTLEERTFVQEFFSKNLFANFRNTPSGELKKLIGLKNKYNIEALFDMNAYLIKIDFVPVSLALAQAAIESGWGKSRFTREANNIFGQWTWGKHGIIPEHRDENKTHRIRIFSTLQDSIDAYILNLNRHYAYSSFREERKKFRDEKKRFNGIEAAKTMIYYSSIREKYVKILNNVIMNNKLLYYDNE